MHPILFKIGNFTVGTYGVMIVIGMLSGLWLMARLARRRGLPPEFFYDLAFVLLLSGFVGARVFNIIIEWKEFVKDPAGMIFSRSGFVFQGGFIAALICGLWFTRRRKVPLLETVDIVAPGLVLAHAFGRIGCFLAGCCYGLTCTGTHHPLLCKLAVQYPLITDHGQPAELFNFAYAGQLAQGLIGPEATAPLPILPVQLFESFGNFLICLVLVWAWRRRRFSGQIFALYMGLYSVLRFSLEYLRGDEDRGVYFGGVISTAQIIALVTLAGAIGLWWYRHNKGIVAIPEPALTAADGAAAGEQSPASAKARSSRKRPKAPTSR